VALVLLDNVTKFYFGGTVHCKHDDSSISEEETEVGEKERTQLLGVYMQSSSTNFPVPFQLPQRSGFPVILPQKYFSSSECVLQWRHLCGKLSLFSYGAAQQKSLGATTSALIINHNYGARMLLFLHQCHISMMQTVCLISISQQASVIDL
jgi:hypothetical protein